MADSSSEVYQPSFTSNQVKSLLSLVQSTLDNICAEVSIDEFREVFDGVKYFEENPKKLYKIYSSFSQKVKESVMVSLKDVIKDDEFDNKFCILNEINSEKTSSGKTPAWRPSGNVGTDKLSYIMSVKLKMNLKLEMLLTEKEASIDNLKKKVLEMREKAYEKDKEILELINMISSINEEYEKINQEGSIYS